MTDACSPGSHPHADRPNWRPAETIDAYMANCLGGLEQYSDSRAARLLGIPRVALWRARLMANIPEDLFERLLRLDPKPSTKSLALIGQALNGGKASPDVECCPHCGGILRLRARIRPNVAAVINDWAREQQAASEAAP